MTQVVEEAMPLFKVRGILVVVVQVVTRATALALTVALVVLQHLRVQAVVVQVDTTQVPLVYLLVVAWEYSVVVQMVPQVDNLTVVGVVQVANKAEVAKRLDKQVHQ